MLFNGLINTGVIVSFLTFWASNGLATSKVTAEGRAILMLRQWIELYAMENHGAIVRNWEELSRVYDIEKINNILVSRGTAPIQDRYQFISQDLFYELYGITGKCRVLLIRTVPLIEKETEEGFEPREKRYIIFQFPDGSFGSSRVPEQEIQAMLKKANLTITPKPGLPPVETGEFLPGMDPNARPNPYDGRGAPSPNLKNSGIPPTPPIRASTHTASSPSKTAPVPVTTGVEGGGLPGAWLVGGVVAVGLLVLLVLGYRGFRK